jgi:tetratricopeptide (TPR) repeat protein
MGRDVAWRVADSVLTGALAGKGRLLLVAGEAGIGKTTLVRSLAEDADARGAVVRWGACWEGGSLLPFAAWIDALRRPSGDRCGAVAARLGDARVGQATDAASAARARSRLFADVVDALEQEASTQPQIVVLEDLHWADAPTLELVRAVAAHLPAMAAVVAATYRDDELDAADLAGIGGAAEWLTLGGLPETEVAPLLAAALGREPSTDEVRSVYRQTGGNPLFVTQVGRLLAAGAPASVPAGVREVLARRLARLSPGCDRVLAVAAVLGTTFDVGNLIAITGESHNGVVAALDEAARARVAQPVDARPDRWSFVHDLVRAARYEALGAGERAELHRRALDVLEGRGHTAAGVLAHHAARARFAPGDVRPAALAVGAAHEALARLAWPEALNLCERALDVAPDGLEGDLWRAEALLAAGDARLRMGDDDKAADAFGGAAGLGRRHERWDLVARAALGFAAGLASFEVPLMEPRQVALLEEAADVLGDDSPLRPLVLARLSVALSLMGADQRRLRLADEAVRLARAGGDPAASRRRSRPAATPPRGRTTSPSGSVPQPRSWPWRSVPATSAWSCWVGAIGSWLCSSCVTSRASTPRSRPSPAAPSGSVTPSTRGTCPCGRRCARTPRVGSTRRRHSPGRRGRSGWRAAASTRPCSTR